MRFPRKHKTSQSTRFPAFRAGNGNRDAQRVSAEINAIRAHASH